MAVFQPAPRAYFRNEPAGMIVRTWSDLRVATDARRLHFRLRTTDL
jgi:hypothetical protein